MMTSRGFVVTSRDSKSQFEAMNFGLMMGWFPLILVLHLWKFKLRRAEKHSENLIINKQILIRIKLV